VPFRIHRVVIDVEPARVMRLQTPPDPQRSTIYDHIAIGNRLLDVEWYPDGSHVAFVSTSRDAREIAFRVADASTGEVRTLFTETLADAVPVRVGGDRAGELARDPGGQRRALVVAAGQLGPPLPVRPADRRPAAADHVRLLERASVVHVDERGRTSTSPASAASPGATRTSSTSTAWG
jgi:hypothetical protein